MVQQLPDGRGTLFAPVAARRQKEIKRGIDTYAKHVCRRRRDGSQYFPLFVLFVLFGQAKRTLKEKKHNVTFPLSYFCVTKRMVQGGVATSERRRRDGVYQKSARRTCAVLLPNHRGVHEFVARAVRGECVRQRGKGKIGSFTALRNLNHTTRANISHEEAEQIRARIVCTPA